MPKTRRVVSGMLMGSAAKCSPMMSNMTSRPGGCDWGISFCFISRERSGQRDLETGAGDAAAASAGDAAGSGGR